MPLMLWGGKLLIVGGKLATDPNCCCEETAGCCGRKEPGPYGQTGTGYYPLTLHARLTAGSCTLPASPVDFDLTWNNTEGSWMNTDVDIGDSHYSLTTVRLNCAVPNWRAQIVGGICFCGTLSGCEFDITPTLTDGTCDPVNLSGTATMSGLNCCGNFSGGSMTLTVWE